VIDQPPKISKPLADEELSVALWRFADEVNAVVDWINERTKPRSPTMADIASDPRFSGLRGHELGALEHLRAYGPMSAVTLRKQLLRRNVGYVLHQLTRRGLIEKERVVDDPRNPVYRAMA
jgi:hypothetical protein